MLVFRAQRGTLAHFGSRTCHRQRARKLCNVAPHDHGRARWLLIIALAPPDIGKSGAVDTSARAGAFISSTSRNTVRTPRPARSPRWVISRFARKATAALALGAIATDRISASSPPIRDTDEADHRASAPQPVRQRVALGEHVLEFGFAPAAIERRRRESPRAPTASLPRARSMRRRGLCRTGG